jgi:N-acetylglucosamine malate deacetylase 2
MTTSAFAPVSPRAAGVHRAGWLSAHAPASAVRSGQLSRGMDAAPADSGLPPGRTVLAVIARPGQESAGLGALLYAFRRAGARLALLCLTRGEASPLNSTCQRLEAIRPFELQLAAGLLGVSSVAVADYPDGGLGRYPVPALTERVQRAIVEDAPDLLLVLDPTGGDPDDAPATLAACLAAGTAGVPVAARTVPGTRSGWTIELGPWAAAARAAARSAAAAHASQADALPEVRRRLDRLGDREQLRWLLPP